MSNFKKYVALVLVMLSFGLQNSVAQEIDSTVTSRFKARNAVYVEIGGAAVVYSLNYDRLVSVRHIWKVGGRVGVGLLNFSLYDSRVTAEIYALKAIKGHAGRFFELGLGGLYRAPRLISETPHTTDISTIGLVPRVGFRYQPLNGGTVFRIGFTPIITLSKDASHLITPWAGFSIGRSF